MMYASEGILRCMANVYLLRFALHKGARANCWHPRDKMNLVLLSSRGVSFDPKLALLTPFAARSPWSLSVTQIVGA